MTLLTWFMPMIVALVGLLLLQMPRFTRPDIYFGVTVDPAFPASSEGLQIGRRYRTMMFMVAALSFFLAGASVVAGHQELSGIGLATLSIGCIVVLARVNRETRPYAVTPSAVREAALVTRPDSLPGGWILAAVPFLILVLAGVYLHQHWDEIPDRFPIHWGIDMQPNGWAERTPGSVYGFLFMGAAVCAMLAVMALGLGRTRQISQTGSAVPYEQRFRALNVWALVASEYLIALLFAGLPVFTILHPGTIQVAVAVNLVITLLLVAVLIGTFIYYGQGGTRLAGTSALSMPPVGDRTSDDCWKWGILYFNPGDPSIFVEKRFGIGYTLNFANRWSWLILAGTLLPVLIGILFVQRS